MKERPLDSLSFFSKRIKAAAARIRLSLPARPVSLGQGVRMLMAAFRDLVRWQAHQERAIRVQLGIVVLLLIWLCGISAPTAVISSMTGGEGMAALLATPTPSPVPVTAAVYDMHDNPKDMDWVAQTYGSWIERASPPPGSSVYRIVELRERTGPSSLDAYVIDANGDPVPGIQVRCWWADGEDVRVTDAEGRVGFDMGSYGGGYQIEVAMGVPSDTAWNLGMLGDSTHRHLDVVFQLMP